MLRIITKLTAITSLSLVMLGVGGNMQGPSAAEFVTIGGGGTGGTFYAVAAGMARIIEKNVSGVKATARVTSATLENTRLLGRKQIELALVAANGPFNAATGKAPFVGEKINNIRYVVAGYSSTLQIAVPKDSEITSITQFKGKRIGVLVGITAQDWFPRVAEVFGIKDQYEAFALRPAELQTALRDGNVDSSVYWGSAPAAPLSDLTTSRDIRFLPVPAAQAKEVLKTHPFFFESVLPKGLYRGVDQDVVSLDVPILLVTRAELSDDLVYRMTKVLMEHNADLAKIHPKAGHFGMQNAGKSMVIPLHPGVARYYKEKGVPTQ